MRFIIQGMLLFFLILSHGKLIFAKEVFWTKPWKGDYDGMVKRRVVRFLVVYSKTSYFVDKGDQKGISYEAGKIFEEEINKDRKDKALKR